MHFKFTDGVFIKVKMLSVTHWALLTLNGHYNVYIEVGAGTSNNR